MSTPTWQVPANVAAAVAAQWPEQGPRWVANAATELGELCARYDAEPQHVFPARYGFVVAAITAGGSQLVMRSSPDPSAANQAAVAQALARLDLGPTIHEVVQTGTATWTIADRVLPGTSLIDAPKDRSIYDAIERVFQRLANQPAPRPDMPKLTDWLRGRLEDDNLTDLAPNRQPATPAEREHALAVLNEMEKGAPRDALCHGDLSGPNLILSPGGLRLIDPRGVVGERAYDAAVLIFKGPSYGLSDKLMVRAVEGASIDISLLRAWAIVVAAARV